MRFLVVAILLCASCEKSTRNWTRPTGLSAEEAVVSTNAALETLYAQGFESERLDLVNGGLLVGARFNGHEKKMLLDTGATFSSIGKGRAETFGLLIGDFSNEEDKVFVTWLDVLKGQQLALARSFQVAGYDYSPWVFGTHESLRGDPLLGSEYLRFSAAVIFTRFRFLAIQPDGIPAKSLVKLLKGHGFAELPMHGWDYSATLKIKRGKGTPIKFGVPYVNVKMNGRSGRMLVDTGAHMSIVYRDLVADKANEFYRYQDSASIDAAGNRQDKYAVLLENLVINDAYQVKHQSLFNAKDISKRKAKMQELGLAEDNLDMGALGLDFLVEHNAIIDMGNMTLYLRFN
ncbi:pepsin/retropepsin-like aspartic protease family protein [Turneriella parva]|uniref:Peptidase A2 domain-containing protein n=1 Tax=Turneriella parva (strain ATCC BAA-1111 / DSM 21527 / NCTC 11395 / H) TaxID=869212 RepID=I4B0S7_TURPD|nr:pepsin/retropepsin-like aspartic protease family protein [Turneriella parva]AFM10884.1 hypothetical protein Turpa_0224 [Turneriella parva DSM 21527]